MDWLDVFGDRVRFLRSAPDDFFGSGISMEFQSDSNTCGDAIKLYGNNIEAGTAQAHF
jgi:hypothetical protein